MRGRTAGVAVALAVASSLTLAAGGPAGAQEHRAMGGTGAGHVSMLFAAFTPVQTDVLAGDTVTWTNDSVRAHDIVARDRGFDSGRVIKGDTFAHRFDAEGSYPYYCSIHPVMTGEVDVHRILLDRPAQHGAPDRPFVLSGRSAVEGSVEIEGDDGSGFHRVATAPVAADGSFRVSVVPRTTTTYRAVAGDAASPPVPLLVEDRSVLVATGRHRRATTVSIRVAPTAPHQTVVLQLRLPERFGWWPVRRVRLDHMSRARFAVRTRRHVRARVLLTLADGATELARSRTFRVGR